MCKVGIVGFGKIAEKHLAAHAKMPDVEVILADAATWRAEGVGRKFGVQVEEVMAENAPEVRVPRGRLQAGASHGTSGSSF